MDAREPHHVAHRRDLPLDARRRFRRGGRVEEDAPRRYEPAGRVRLFDRALDRRPTVADEAVLASGLPRTVDGAAVEVLLGERRVGQALPDLLGRRADVGLEDVSGDGHGSVPSRERLRSTIAESVPPSTGSAANFEIHRS